jgi:glycosyltransferase involved in cell wall biosynthesis
MMCAQWRWDASAGRNKSIMKLNVLMTVFNGGSALDQTMESLLTQTYPDFSFVIVEDGSEDDTWTRLKGYAEGDSRIRLIPLSHNHGIAGALNIGLQHVDTDCEYVARIDCGDSCAPDRMRKQVDFLAGNPGYRVVGSRFEMFSKEGELPAGILRFQNFSNALCTHEEIINNFTVMSPFAHPTITFRRQVFAEVGLYDEGYEAAEDYELVGRILTRGFLVHKMPEALVACRFTPGRGISQTRRVTQVKTALEVKLQFLLANYLPGDQERQCIIWGSREFAGYLAEKLAEGRHRLRTRCFTDFDPTVWGQEKSALRLLPPQDIAQYRLAGDIIITMWNQEREEIITFLTRNGWVRNRDFFVFS